MQVPYIFLGGVIVIASVVIGGLFITQETTTNLDDSAVISRSDISSIDEENREKNPASAKDDSVTEIVMEPIECVVLLVGIQPESGLGDSEYHCENANSIMYELQGLPQDFDQIYQRHLKSTKKKLTACQSKTHSDKVGLRSKVKIRISHSYRLLDKYRIILTKESKWSLSMDLEHLDCII